MNKKEYYNKDVINLSHDCGRNPTSRKKHQEMQKAINRRTKARHNAEFRKMLETEC